MSLSILVPCYNAVHFQILLYLNYLGVYLLTWDGQGRKVGISSNALKGFILKQSQNERLAIWFEHQRGAKKHKEIHFWSRMRKWRWISQFEFPFDVLISSFQIILSTKLILFWKHMNNRFSELCKICSSKFEYYKHYTCNFVRYKIKVWHKIWIKYFLTH